MPRSIADRLAAATREAVTRLRAEHPREHFYFIALFTTDYGHYAVLSAWSEEALAAQASNGPPRFSAPDSPYHWFCPELFRGLPSGPRLHDACFEALRILDAEGFFGRGARRAEVVINVVYGDMSDERWLAHAERLNPPRAVARVRSHLHIQEPEGQVKRWGASAYQVNALSLSADRRLLAYSGSGGEVGVYRLGTRRTRVYEQRRRGAHWACVLDPTGKNLYLGDRDGILVLDPTTGKSRLLAKIGKPSSLVVAAGGAWVASTSWDDPLALFSTKTGERLWQLRGPANPGGLAFSPNDRHLAEATEILRVFDTKTGRQVARRNLGLESSGPLAWSPDGKLLAVRDSGNRAIALLKWPGLTRIRAIGAAIEVDAIAFSPSGRRLAHCSGSVVSVIDATSGKTLASGQGKQESLHDCVFTDERTVLAAGRDVNEGSAILELRI
jgi:WD40 repeat protein